MFIITNVWEKHCIYLRGFWLSPLFPFPLVYFPPLWYWNTQPVNTDLPALYLSMATCTRPERLFIVFFIIYSHIKNFSPFTPPSCLLLDNRLYMAKLTILWYDNFGKNQTPLQRNGMTAIPKNMIWICVSHYQNEGALSQFCCSDAKVLQNGKTNSWWMQIELQYTKLMRILRNYTRTA